MQKIRTDLAMEAHQLWQEQGGSAADLRGVRTDTRELFGYDVTTVRIESDPSAKTLGKPRGTYVTVDLKGLKERREDAFRRGCMAVGRVLEDMLKIKDGDTVLVAGLGNTAVTPDAVGPTAVRNLLVTRHLMGTFPESLPEFRPVAAMAPGVLAETGMESGEMIRCVAQRLSPAAVIAVDALAGRSMERICRTVQIADSGIVPGSGVGNARMALSRDTLGVPVIAVGVPTVVDAGTLAADILRNTGYHNIPEDRLSARGADMIVTPRDIDADMRELGKLLGSAITLALQPNLTFDDVTALLS